MNDAARCPSRSATCSTRSRSSSSSAPTRCGTTASARSPSAQDGEVSPEGFEDALHDRARQRLRQPRQPHAEHAPPLRATRRCPTSTPDPALAADFDGLVDEVCELLDRAEVTQALERIWQRVRRLNRYVEEHAPWKLAKDPDAGRRSSHVVLRSLAEGLRAVTVLLHPVPARQSTAKLLAALGDERHRARRRRLRRRAPRAADRRARARCSRSRSDRQPHPPRPRRPGEDADDRRRARARSASRGMLTDRHGPRVLPSARSRSRALRRRSSPPSAATRTRPTGFTDADAEWLAELARRPALPRGRGDRPRRLPRLRAARRPGARLRRPDRDRPRRSASRSSSTRARPTTTRSTRSTARRATASR